MLKDNDIATLRSFIIEQLAAGASEQQLRASLMSEGGWLREDLDMVFALIRNTTNASSTLSTPLAHGTMSTSPSPAWDASPLGMKQAGEGEPQGMTAPNTIEPSLNMGMGNTGMPNMSDPFNNAHSRENAPAPAVHPKRAWLLAGSLLGIVLLGGGAFAAYHFFGSSFDAPYTEENFLSGILSKIQSIDSSTFTVSGSARMEARDPDAEPFVLTEGDDVRVYREAYKRDSVRFQHLKNLLRNLSGVSRSLTYDPDVTVSDYPATLDEALRSNGYSTFNMDDDEEWLDPTRDPKTGELYEYRVVNDGDDFELTITFETADAIKEVRSNIYSDADDVVTIDGMKVTFTKSSNGWYYMPSEPSKPFLVELSEQARFLPPELDTSFLLESSVDMRDTQETDWGLVLEGKADFGDMEYKAALDVRKVDTKYYARLRNLPGILSMFLPLNKNEWVTIDPDADVESASEQDGGLGLGESFVEGIVEMEEEYDEYRDQQAKMVEKLLEIAGEEKLIRFREEPFKEKLGDRDVYRYNITVRKEAILPFLTKAIESMNDLDSRHGSPVVNDAGLVEYLKGDAFDQTFDYLEKNMQLLVYVDSDGYPVKNELSMRLVPPDTATKLREKQLRTVASFEIDNINKPIQIEIPAGSRPIREVIEEFEKNMDYSEMGAIPSALNMAANALSSFLIMK